MKKLLEVMGKHKVLVVLLILILVGAILTPTVILPKLKGNQSAAAAAAMAAAPRTTTLSRSTLNDSVTVSGKVQASDTTNITVGDKVKTFKLADIKVEVGDKVNTGDVIAVLDTGDLLTGIDKAEKAYNDAIRDAQTALTRAKTDFEVARVQHENKLIDFAEAITKADERLEDAKDIRDQAKANRDAAAAKYSQLSAEYSRARSEISAFQDEVDRASSALNEALKKWNEEMSKVNAEIENNADEAQKEFEEAQSDLKDKQEALDNAKSGYSNPALGIYSYEVLETSYTAAQTALTSAESALSSSDNAVSSAEDAVKAAHSNYDNEKNTDKLMTLNRSIEDKQRALKIAREDTSKLDELKEQLSECTLTANMSGTITAVDAIVGAPCTGSVATIQNVSGLTVAVTIPADEVPTVAIGMKCSITTDASPLPVAGTVTQIDPSANDSGNFGATVSVDTEDSGLLIGTSAQVEIIRTSYENLFVVPMDAVGTDTDGSKYVLRQTAGTDSYEQVTVTVSGNNGYSCAMDSASLAEGDVISSSVLATKAAAASAGGK